MESSTGKRHVRSRPSSRFAVRTAIRSACLAGSAAAAVFASSGSYAAASDDTSDTALTEVVVTGSRIGRIDLDTPSPVQVVTAEDIANSGYTSVQDVLHALTANGQGNLNQSFGGAFAAGAAGVSLRNMTVDATLVLIDGHRMANYPISDDGQRSFVDVANLPLSVIDHVEVLKDGASAIYGSDAIAGVVNIILKKQFVGAEVSADAGTSAYHDATTEHFTATFGTGDLAVDGHNTYLNLEYRHEQSLSLNARSPYNNFDYYDKYGPDAPTAFGVVQPGSAFPFTNTLQGMVGAYNPANPANPTAFQSLSKCPDPNVSGGATLGGCAYNYSLFQQIQPQTSNINVLLRHTQEFGAGWSGTVTASMFESKAEQVNAPSSASTYQASTGGAFNSTDPTANPILIPIGNVNNPYPGNPAWLAYLFGDVGAQHTLTDTRMYRFVTDIKGSFAGFDMDASIGVVRGLTHLTYENYVTVSGLNDVLANDTYHIGATSDLNTQAVYNTLAPTTRSVASSQLQYIELNVTRSLFQLPGGPLGWAFGVGGRHDGQSDPGQPDTINGDVLGLGTTFIQGLETNENVYTEFDAPIYKWLEIDAADRYDNYAGVGGANTPKVGIEFKPLDQVKFRGTYARGFRAPGPGERGNSGVTFFTAEGTDDARCPTTGLPADCGSGQIAGVVAGNPALKPEKSDSYTLGIVLQPLRQVSISLDWWRIRRTGEILADFSNPIVVRGPVQAAYPGIPGPEIEILGPYQNLGVDEPTGADLEIHAKMDLAVGQLGFDGTFTHLISQKICSAPDDPSTCVYVDGTHGPSGISGDTGTPRNHMVATASYTLQGFEAGITSNYVSGYVNDDPTIGATGPQTGGTGCLNAWYTKCYISSFTDFDLFGRYQITKQLNLDAHVLNAFNAKAPFDPQAAYGTRNYNNAFAAQGAIGPFFELGIKWTL
jgi:iron complex outermembrane receptor protein